MSYCRWSSDDWTCDVYVYEDVSGGWTTHVAGRKRRPIEGRPMPTHPDVTDWKDKAQTAAFFKAHRAQMAWLDDETNFIWEDLPPSHAGESYNDSTPGECADRLEEIRAAGFNVPQYAIDELREEQASLVTPGNRQ